MTKYFISHISESCETDGARVTDETANCMLCI